MRYLGLFLRFTCAKAAFFAGLGVAPAMASSHVVLTTLSRLV
jgi:hypothetical protein